LFVTAGVLAGDGGFGIELGEPSRQLSATLSGIWETRVATLKVDDERGFGNVNAGIDKLCLHEILLLVFGVQAPGNCSS
jgi:hypothetical protein